MKRSLKILCGVVLLCNTLCVAQDLVKSYVDPNDTEEALKLAALLESTRVSTTLKPAGSSTSKAKTTSDNHADDHEYNFQNDRLPMLTEDESNNLDHDANPLHFLKQLFEPQADQISPPANATEPSSTKPQTEPIKPPENLIKSEPVAGAPIYITIPIYINTSGKMPLSLTIGDQEMPLQRRTSTHKKSHSTKSPNSYFNRLLEQIEPPKRRTTNRHRSQSRNRIQALKENNQYEKLALAKGQQ